MESLKVTDGCTIYSHSRIVTIRVHCESVDMYSTADAVSIKEGISLGNIRD